MSLFDPNNSFWQTFSKIMDVFGLSLCWLVTCVPVVTAGSATCALYDAAYHGLREGEPGVYARFFRTFRRELKISSLLTLGVLLGYGVYRVLFAVSYTMAISGNSFAGVLVYAYRLLFLVPAGGWLIAMALLSRFTFTAKSLFSTAVRLMLTYPVISAIVTGLGFLAFSVMCYWPFSFLFLPAGTALVLTLFLERIFDLYLED